MPLSASSESLLQTVTTLLEDKKIDKIIVIDLITKSTIADYMIIAEGTSSRQLVAAAEHVREQLKSQGIVVAMEGVGQSDWVLIDAGNVIVHLFRPETRGHYDLEKMWGGSSK